MSSDSTVIVTGATGGLGAAVVSRLLAEGRRVVAPWRSDAGRERLEQLGPGAGADDAGELVLVRGDLNEPGDVDRLVAVAGEDAGAPLTGLVNLVGGFASAGRVHETPIQDFEGQLRINLRPVYLVTAAALPLLQAGGGGSIVCVGSRAASVPFSGAAGYIAAKAALTAFAQAVAVEYRRDGIRCNVVVPSTIDTPANRAAMPKADVSRWVAPEEIAELIAYLLSAGASATSGAAVPVYGRA